MGWGGKRLTPFFLVLGYSSIGTLDIGRPDRFWHGFVFWNIHSPLWEVTMCVGLYFSVLMMEVLPIIGHWEPVEHRFPRISSRLTSLHKLTRPPSSNAVCSIPGF